MEVVFYLALCALIGYWANCRGRSAILWAVLAFALSPLLSGIALAIMKDLSNQADISELRMGQQQLHDRIATNEKMTAQQFQQVQQQLSAQQQQQQYLQQSSQQQYLSERPHSQDSFCANCGTRIAAGEKFCPNCGAKVEE